MNSSTTEHEKFWSGNFGTTYIDRNPIDFELPARLALFCKILSSTGPVNSCIEFGANVGNNLRALIRLIPSLKCTAVEINNEAVSVLKQWGCADVIHQSLFDFSSEKKFNLTFVSGVLIHLEPSSLPAAYDQLYTLSDKYICMIEYYNPSFVEVEYRGHSGKLYKRDFAGEIMEKFPDLTLVDYGFVYRRDPSFPLDDLTWFLFKK